MNRRDRRAQAAIGRPEAEKWAAGSRWSQRPDPEDPTYALIEIRVPTGPNLMPEATYEGKAAAERLGLWARHYMHGVEDARRERDEN
jgi:hypothetical protein